MAPIIMYEHFLSWGFLYSRCVFNRRHMAFNDLGWVQNLEGRNDSWTGQLFQFLINTVHLSREKGCRPSCQKQKTASLHLVFVKCNIQALFVAFCRPYSCADKHLIYWFGYLFILVPWYTIWFRCDFCAAFVNNKCFIFLYTLQVIANDKPWWKCICVDDTLLWKSLGLIRFFYVFERSLLCSQRLHILK